MKAIINSIVKTFVISLMLIANTSFSYAQTASILPPAKTQLFDSNGNPLAGGKVDYYIPGTTTRKTTWQDAGQTVPNANPVILDSAGRALMLGDGAYRQVVKDRNNSLIWDAVTSSTGSGGGGSTATVGDGQPVGSIQLWAGLIAPQAYAFAYGQEFTRAGFPELFQALTLNQNVTCTIGSPILTSVSSTQNFSTGTKIESVCLGAGATVISVTSSTVTASSNAIISTTSTARFFPYGNGDGNLTFNVPDLRGRILVGRDDMGGIAANRVTSLLSGCSAGIGGTCGTQNQDILQSQLPNVVIPFSSSSGSASVTTTSSRIFQSNSVNGIISPGAGAIFAVAGIDANTSAVSSTGSANASGNTNSINGNVTQVGLNMMQPSLISNYVIKTTPDSNPNSFFGVASIGGMYGVLTCGSGISCSGNQISASLTGTISCGDLTNGGTGCQANTGASGHVVPFLDGINIFSGTSNTFTNGITVSNGSAYLLANASATPGPAVDTTIQGLTLKTPIDANNDYMLLWDNVSGALRKVTPGQIGSVGVAGVSSLGGQTGSLTCENGVTCVSGSVSISLLPLYSTLGGI